MTNPLEPIGEGVLGPLKKAAKAPGAEGPSFADLLKSQIERVNQMKLDAEQAMEQLATGQRSDIDHVFVAVEKADLAFRALMEIRNKLLSAWEEINRMQVG